MRNLTLSSSWALGELLPWNMCRPRGRLVLNEYRSAVNDPRFPEDEHEGRCLGNLETDATRLIPSFEPVI
jgi:hypothetical protein